MNDACEIPNLPVRIPEPHLNAATTTHLSLTMFFSNQKPAQYDKLKDEVVVDLMDKVVANFPLAGGIIVNSEAVSDLTENQILQMMELNYQVQDLMREYGYIGTSDSYAQPITAIGHAAKKAGGHHAYQRLLDERNKPQLSSTNIYNLTGYNSRVYQNSSDQSNNVVSSTNDELFHLLRQEISSKIDENDKLLDLISELEQSVGKSSYKEKYISFIANAANHMTVLAPFIPALTSLLNGG